jgi:hypothetical protein
LDLTSCINDLLVQQPIASPLIAGIAAPRNRMAMHVYQNRSYEHLGKKCTTNSDCRNLAECIFNVCACPPKTIANATEYCVPESTTNTNHNDDLPKALPGEKCNNLCGMGALCKPISTLTPHCVCDARLVTNSTGHCTTKLLANSKKSRFIYSLCFN